MTESAASTPSASAAPAARPARPPQSARWTLHSGTSISRLVGTYAMGAFFPLAAGLLVFGWRALGCVLVVLISTALAMFFWKRAGPRGAQLRYDHGLWLALLLSLALPPHLFGGVDPQSGAALWPILVAAGFLLVIFTWLLGGIGSGRVHPVLITYLLLFVCFRGALVPEYALQRRSIFVGDLLNAMPAELASQNTLPWVQAPEVRQFQSVRMTPASETLLAYTSGGEVEQRAWRSLDSLLRDQMPPLEDLIVGGHPASIGSASLIALIIGGLFLLYRGVIDARVPLVIFLSAIVAMLVLPVPVVVRENDVLWRWLVMRSPDVGWRLALALVSYEVAAAPLALTAFFLATSSAVRPIARRARVTYAMLIGVLTAVFLYYVSVSIGPYLALLTASMVSPALDKMAGSRTLV